MGRLVGGQGHGTCFQAIDSSRFGQVRTKGDNSRADRAFAPHIDASVAHLAPHAPLLAPELAILASKVGNPLPSRPTYLPAYTLGNAHEALSLLVRTIHGDASAAAICTPHGAVVFPQATTQLAKRAGPTAWVLASPSTTVVPTDSAGANTSVSPSPSPPFPITTTTVTTTTTTEAATPATAHLLSSHATFDPSAVISTLPSQWPLRTLSLYLIRTLRIRHTRHTSADSSNRIHDEVNFLPQSCIMVQSSFDIISIPCSLKIDSMHTK
ncbi:hypothetical protein BGW80DRAFT_1458893 [Lactifluus volemus]|nr:hypothetical protein BGW80DRAFT_1458893 [Lactifluus volemus]